MVSLWRRDCAAFHALAVHGSGCGRRVSVLESYTSGSMRRLHNIYNSARVKRIIPLFFSSFLFPTSIEPVLPETSMRPHRGMITFSRGVTIKSRASRTHVMPVLTPASVRPSRILDTARFLSVPKMSTLQDVGPRHRWQPRILCESGCAGKVLRHGGQSSLVGRGGPRWRWLPR